MSLRTWIKEFYPVPADCVTKDRALAHSLRKWEGTMKRNLKRHGVVFEGLYVEGSDGKFSFDSGTCALCQIYHATAVDCCDCPLHRVRGCRCDQEIRDGQTVYGGPYCAAGTGDPWPMIRLLRRAMKVSAK